MEERRRVVRVGSRNSQLALIQTHHVIDRLKELNPDLEFDITTMMTLGDRILNVSLPKIGEKSLFTRELEDALAKKTVDIIVHSLKDLPTTLPDGMAIGAILEREDPRDALVLRQDLKGSTLETLPPGSIIGTSSLRRTAQLAKLFPHLKVVDIRGNLNTRLSKLDKKMTNQNNQEYDYSGLILATAGLTRMGWHDRISQVLPCSTLMYAVGQGALAIECRSDDDDTLKMLSPLSDMNTYCRALAERSFLKTLGGGCSAPVAVSTSLKKYTDNSGKGLKLKMSGAVWSLDGKSTANGATDCAFPSYTENATGKHKLAEENTATEAKRPRSSGDTENIDEPSGCSETCTNDKEKCCVRNKAAIDIENLINIHGKLFISCPYSSQNGLCPIDIPIGQDFMAKCPFFDVEKGGLSSVSSNIDVTQCPFMSDQLSTVPNKRNTETTSNVPLFCGLTKHLEMSLEVVKKCENLGFDLAQSLIKDGALDIMKATQDYIHSFHGGVKK